MLHTNQLKFGKRNKYRKLYPLKILEHQHYWQVKMNSGKWILEVTCPNAKRKF